MATKIGEGIKQPEKRFLADNKEITEVEFFERMRQLRYDSLPEMKIALIRDGAIFHKANEFAAGYDVKAFERTIEGKYVKYKLGIMSEIPQGWYAELIHKSSNSDKDGIVGNTKGTIDCDFRGEWQARIKILQQPDLKDVEGRIYFTEVDRNLYPLELWEEGEIAMQVIFHKLDEHRLSFVKKEELSSTVRGEGGHGSTGNGLKFNPIPKEHLDSLLETKDELPIK